MSLFYLKNLHPRDGNPLKQRLNRGCDFQPRPQPRLNSKLQGVTKSISVNGRGRFGGQTAGGHPKAFSQLRQPLFAVPALRELESACRVSI